MATQTEVIKKAIELLVNLPGNEYAKGKVVKGIYLGPDIFVIDLANAPAVIEGEYQFVQSNQVSIFDLMDMEQALDL